MAWMDMIPWGRGSKVPVHREPTGMAVSSLQEEMNRLFDRFFDTSYPSFEFPSEPREWRPSVDIAETDGEFEISAELPGVDEKDIEVSVSDGSLSIKGTRTEEKKDENKEYHHREQYFGSFHRVIPLPTSVDPDQVKATYKKGVLRVTLPKSESSRPTKVAVTGG